MIIYQCTSGSCGLKWGSKHRCLRCPYCGKPAEADDENAGALPSDSIRWQCTRCGEGTRLALNSERRQRYCPLCGEPPPPLASQVPAPERGVRPLPARGRGLGTKRKYESGSGSLVGSFTPPRPRGNPALAPDPIPRPSKRSRINSTDGALPSLTHEKAEKEEHDGPGPGRAEESEDSDSETLSLLMEMAQAAQSPSPFGAALPTVLKTPPAGRHLVFQCARCKDIWACTAPELKPPPGCVFCPLGKAKHIKHFLPAEAPGGASNFPWKSRWCGTCQATTYHQGLTTLQRCSNCGRGRDEGNQRVLLGSKPYRGWSKTLLGPAPEGSLYAKYGDWPHGAWLHRTGQLVGVGYLDVKGPGDALRFLHALTQWSRRHEGAPAYVFTSKKLREQVEGLRYLVATGSRAGLRDEDHGIRVRAEDFPLAGVGPVYWVDVHQRAKTNRVEMQEDLRLMKEHLEACDIEWHAPEGTSKPAIIFEGYNGHSRYHLFDSFKFLRLDLNVEFMEGTQFHYTTLLEPRPERRNPSIVLFLRKSEEQPHRNLQPIHLNAVYDVALSPEWGRPIEVVLGGHARQEDYARIVEEFRPKLPANVHAFYAALVNQGSFIAYAGMSYCDQYEVLTKHGLATGMVTSALDLAAAARLPIVRDGDAWQQQEYTGKHYNTFLLCSETRGVSFPVTSKETPDMAPPGERQYYYAEYLKELLRKLLSPETMDPGKVTYKKMGGAEYQAASRTRTPCPRCETSLLFNGEPSHCPGCSRQGW